MKIIELKISNRFIPQKKQWEILTDVYKEVLYKDKNWHFFYEVFFNIIRCSASKKRKVIKVLKRHCVQFEDVGEWVDNQPITKKHQNAFKDIFHQQAELIMKTALDKDADPYDEIWFLGDRMVHCFLNNCHYIAEPWIKEAQRAANWECHIMHRMASGRMSYMSDFNRSTEKIDLSEYGAEYIPDYNTNERKPRVYAEPKQPEYTT